MNHVSKAGIKKVDKIALSFKFGSRCFRILMKGLILSIYFFNNHRASCGRIKISVMKEHKLIKMEPASHLHIECDSCVSQTAVNQHLTNENSSFHSTIRLLFDEKEMIIITH